MCSHSHLRFDFIRFVHATSHTVFSFTHCISIFFVSILVYTCISHMSNSQGIKLRIEMKQNDGNIIYQYKDTHRHSQTLTNTHAQTLTRAWNSRHNYLQEEKPKTKNNRRIKIHWTKQNKTKREKPKKSHAKSKSILGGDFWISNSITVCQSMISSITMLPPQPLALPLPHNFLSDSIDWLVTEIKHEISNLGSRFEPVTNIEYRNKAHYIERKRQEERYMKTVNKYERE